MECQAVVLLVVSCDLLSLDRQSLLGINVQNSMTFSFWIADNLHIQDMWGFVARVTPSHDASLFSATH